MTTTKCFLTIAAAVVLFNLPVRAQSPDTRKIVALENIVAVNCPDQVPTSISKVPTGWTSANGPEARERLVSVVITSESGKASIGCIYGHKGEYGAFVLSKAMSPNYDCKVETWPSSHATCRLKTLKK